MRTKIIEWSSRHIQRRTSGRQLTRWYSALAPNSPVTLAA